LEVSCFSYQAQSWKKGRRVVAKVEWHPRKLYPRVGFIVTNLARPAERIVALYNQRGTCEQYIKEGKNAIKWTRLSCRTFAATAVASNSTFLPTTSATSCGRWRSPRWQNRVADQPTGEADQDGREGRQPRALRDIPDGRGRSALRDVRRNPLADRPVASTAGTSVTVRRRQMRETTTAEARLDAGKNSAL
jgi:Transposase DDE domain group 1